MAVEMHMRIIGLLMLALAAANAALPGRLRWREELARLSLLNRQVFLVHAGFVVLITVLLGSMCVLYARELLEETPLARAMIIGLGAFWGARFLVQVVLCTRSTWRGSGSDAVLQFFFAGLCGYLAGVCAWALVQQVGGVR